MRHNTQMSGILGVYLINHGIFPDSRGKTLVLFDSNEEFLSRNFQNFQCNVSNSNKGVIRGLHYSHGPHHQNMIVTCLSGIISDVLVDIRIGSPTYRKILKIELNPDSNFSLVVPSGVAHGYEVKSDMTMVLYHLSQNYNPKFESTINPFCKDLAIGWETTSPVMSERDRLADDFLASESKGLLPNFTTASANSPFQK